MHDAGDVGHSTYVLFSLTHHCYPRGHVHAVYVIAVYERVVPADGRRREGVFLGLKLPPPLIGDLVQVLDWLDGHGHGGKGLEERERELVGTLRTYIHLQCVHVYTNICSMRQLDGS